MTLFVAVAGRLGDVVGRAEALGATVVLAQEPVGDTESVSVAVGRAVALGATVVFAQEPVGDTESVSVAVGAVDIDGNVGAVVTVMERLAVAQELPATDAARELETEAEGDPDAEILCAPMCAQSSMSSATCARIPFGRVP